MHDVEVIDTPVLIVGGAGCGLAAALFLSRNGVDSYLVERHPQTSPAPKAHYLNPRTMELFREIGLADVIYALSAPLENMQRVGWYTSLGGDGPLDRKTIAIMDAFGGASLREQYEKKSPCRAANYPQLRLEPLMFEQACKENRANLNYNHELVSFTQDADHVLADIRDRATDRLYRVRAQYMIAADGGKKISGDLGVPMDGIARLADMMSAHFVADLSPWIDDDTPMIRWFNNPDQAGGTWGSGVIVAMGPDSYDRHSREWLVHFAFQPDDPAQFDETTIVPRLRTLLKTPDLAMEVLRMNNWQVQGVLARRFREGRIFLAGDAAHRHPPTTGLGLNSAIQDAHNLAWKLAAVLKGVAGDALLDSYEEERRTITGQNVDWAMLAFQNHLVIDAAIGLMPGAPPEVNRGAYELLFSDTKVGAARRKRLAEVVETQRIEFQAQSIETGYHYPSGFFIADGSEAPPSDPMGGEFVPTARPGHRLPHVWLRRRGEKISTHDLAGRGRFALFAGSKGARWIEEADDLAGAGFPIVAYRIALHGELSAAGNDIEEIFGIEAEGAILVRPDGYVALRVMSVEESGGCHLSDLLTDLGLRVTESV